MQDTRQAWTWFRLAHTPEIGLTGALRLLRSFEHIEALASARTAQVLSHLEPRQKIAWVQAEPALRPVFEATCAWTEQAPPGVWRGLLALDDPRYPSPLLQLPDPPLLLHVCMAQPWHEGDPATLQAQWQQQSIAIVGSRNASPQGMHNAHHFARELADRGWTIVSGMALGIDAAAHKGALLNPRVGTTIAIIGTGLDRVYPRQHADLFNTLQRQGMVISEHPLGTEVRPWHFPRRNRLIAALGRGTLVVEAAAQSGSLITAALASELGREVFAIPGSIHQTVAKGCHALIRQGAVLTQSVDDIEEELPRPDTALTKPTQPASSPPPHSIPDYAPWLALIGPDPVSIEQLCEQTRLSAPDLQAALLQLELDNHMAALPGGLVQRIFH